MRDMKTLIRNTTISLKGYMYSSMHEFTILKHFDIKGILPLHLALKKLTGSFFIGLNVIHMGHHKITTSLQLMEKFYVICQASTQVHSQQTQIQPPLFNLNIYVSLCLQIMLLKEYGINFGLKVNPLLQHEHLLILPLSLESFYPNVKIVFISL